MARQAQLASRKPTVLASAVGGLPESKHLDGTNCSEWKFAMKNYLVDAGLWHCVKNENADHELDQRALAKINLSIKLCASECGSMTAYIDRITGIADQLEAIGKSLDDETVGGIILENYDEIHQELVTANNVQQLASPLSKDESCAFVSQNAKEKA
ncbi:hypothetical protein T01_6498, partial [Trichinella spiralis]